MRSQSLSQSQSLTHFGRFDCSGQRNWQHHHSTRCTLHSPGFPARCHLRTFDILGLSQKQVAANDLFRVETWWWQQIDWRVRLFQCLCEVEASNALGTSITKPSIDDEVVSKEASHHLKRCSKQDQVQLIDRKHTSVVHHLGQARFSPTFSSQYACILRCSKHKHAAASANCRTD